MAEGFVTKGRSGKVRHGNGGMESPTSIVGGGQNQLNVLVDDGQESSSTPPTGGPAGWAG